MSNLLHIAGKWQSMPFRRGLKSVETSNTPGAAIAVIFGANSLIVKGFIYFNDIFNVLLGIVSSNLVILCIKTWR